ncbi:hypothetical protein V1520DRAFT_63981 [Lipomyces starkeyi]|uniref:Uncharacterized protein n=1 Tax=Lipomyces starkeyi NRRL Y-11557 TaxID=675824 RepID=A0A1E3QG30_LIPST|nr:hypothetical protein LIPSTDRAFT_140438 [Lipomyces starkeyi NRRL Y-11557]
MPRTSHNFISTTGVLVATLVLVESVAAGSGAPSLLFFKRGATADGASRLAFLENDKSKEPSFSQKSHKELMSEARRRLSFEMDESRIAHWLTGLSNATVETDDVFEVEVEIDGDNGAHYERKCNTAKNDIASDSIPRPSRTSVYADRPWSGKENVLDEMHIESVMYRVPVETGGTANTEFEVDDHEEPILERKVVTASGSRVIVGGRASRDTRFRRGPRPTGGVRPNSSELRDDSSQKDVHFGSMATVAPRSSSNKKGNNRPRAPRITSSPSADAHLKGSHAYDTIDESAVVFDKDSVVLMKIYGIIESVSDTLDERLSDSGIAEKLRELPALWEHYSNQAHAYLKSPISQSLGQEGPVTILSPWTAARLLLANWIDRYPAAIMLLGLLLIMCLL